jgi:ubiquitin-protein ligase
MSIRLRRLQAEHQRLTRLFANHPRIQILEALGDPPDTYVVEYHLQGLVEEKGDVKPCRLHRARISLGPNYPKERPRCIMLTPVFHPNIDHLAVCTEDIGAASQTLDQTIIFIGEMITYQAYNLQSPRNGDAARWTSEHIDELPLENVDLTPAGSTAALAPPAPPEFFPVPPPVVQPPAPPAPAELPAAPATEAVLCPNCGRAPDDGLQFCEADHLVCEDCLLICNNCRKRGCVFCDFASCTQCRSLVCSDCRARCSACDRSFCLEHISVCVTCQSLRCSICAGQCDDCGRSFCGEHLDEDRRCEQCAEVRAAATREEVQPAETETPLVEAINPPPFVAAPLLVPSLAPAVTFFPAREVQPQRAILPVVEPAVQLSPPAIEIWHVETVIPPAPPAEARLEPVPMPEEPTPQPVAAVVPTPRPAEAPGPSVLTAPTPVPRKIEFQPLIIVSSEEVRSVPASALVSPSRHIKIRPIQPPKMSGKALTSLIFAVTGIPVIGILLGWFAILFGGLALREIRLSDRLRGRGLALAGICLGVFDIVAWVVLFAYLISAALRPGGLFAPEPSNTPASQYRQVYKTRDATFPGSLSEAGFRTHTGAQGEC